ncbi:MAG: hypothetical protein IJ887_00495 [Prevotella sp.]|nr:hypothetical protein [Prevotella sp.]
MRTNGTITYRIGAAEGQFDDDGQPIIAESVWSEPVRCFIKTNTHDNKGVSVGGTFSHEAYEVLIERIPEGLDTDVVRLVRGGRELGEFKVQDIQCVCLDRIRIIV